ncbi:MAG: 23S rRNA (guanosine(2251)-2'-O)-methyltransferase RlmB [Neisseriaceae bacterium]|nr:23S rRNA (guanosine(2251)-2'-O)-methyltransferase RlmB [Neisseriaceae bacterium]
MSQISHIYGFHAITARLWQNPESLVDIYLAGGRQDARAQAVLDKAKELGKKCHLVEKARLDAMVGGARHQGVVAMVDATRVIVDIEDILENITEPALLLILDGITDPHNLGACLRVADAMGVHAVIAPKDRSATLNATVAKVACGAAESVPYLTVTNLARTIRDLKGLGIQIIGTDMEGDFDLHHAELTGSVALVMGSEGNGMRRLTRELCDRLVSIPMFGMVESLNVSVATGMVLSETRRQRTLMPTPLVPS